jgi:hypothetical protein
MLQVEASSLETRELKKQAGKEVNHRGSRMNRVALSTSCNTTTGKIPGRKMLGFFDRQGRRTNLNGHILVPSNTFVNKFNNPIQESTCVSYLITSRNSPNNGLLPNEYDTSGPSDWC